MIVGSEVPTAAWVLATAALLLTGAETVIAVVTVWRTRWRKTRSSAAWVPRCAIVVPTKGIPQNFAANLAALLSIDYPAYDIYFVVEAESDPGVPLIRAQIESEPRAYLVVAGLSTTGCQQNHNMLAGVAAAGDVEVLAFCDNDIAPPPHWLRALVPPLADPAVTISTGYRWLCSPHGTFAEHAHTFINMTMYAHFHMVMVLRGVGLWGGSFALRRADFVALGVASRWAETVSDDMSLTEILVRHRRKCALVPELLMVTDDVFDRMAPAVSWYRRQLLNLKAHEWWVWAFAVGPAMALAALLLVWPFVAAAASWALGGSFWRWGGAAGLVMWGGDMITAAVYGAVGPTRGQGWLILRAPLLRLVQCVAWARTLGANSFEWAGIFYRFNRRGQVVEIRRG
jgi:cellulose synthase/poly-beta-1,6-N-acetylglucosamine synthase-like glycosyltransferase